MATQDRTDGMSLEEALQHFAHRQAGRVSSQEFARESLRRAILSGALPAGMVLTQSRVADALGMSTTPVREALRDLASDGLIHIDRYTTTSVHRPTTEELVEVYHLRKLLETHAVTQIIERGDQECLDEAGKIQSRLDDETDPAEWVLLNADFHTALTKGAASRRLSTILDGLRGAVSVYLGMAIRENPSRREESNVEHRELLEACRAGDLPRAIHITEIHMDPTRDAVEHVLGEA